MWLLEDMKKRFELSLLFFSSPATPSPMTRRQSQQLLPHFLESHLITSQTFYKGDVFHHGPLPLSPWRHEHGYKDNVWILSLELQSSSQSFHHSYLRMSVKPPMQQLRLCRTSSANRLACFCDREGEQWCLSATNKCVYKILVLVRQFALNFPPSSHLSKKSQLLLDMSETTRQRTATQCR